MRALLVTFVLAALVPDRPDPTPRENAKPLREQIVGDWQIVTIKIGPEVFVGSATLRITSTHTTVVVDGRPNPGDRFTGPYTMDAALTPVSVEWTDAKFQGIVKMDGEQLVLCVSLGGARPNEFKTTLQGPTVYLMHLRRITK